MNLLLQNDQKEILAYQHFDPMS